MTAHGGKPCDVNEDVRACNTHPCPVNCEYEWQPWSGCSVSCGSGFMTREIVVILADAHGGNRCPGTESKLCNTNVCPTPSPTPAPTPSPTPPPTPKLSVPVINIIGGDLDTSEADKTELYADAGAKCTDEVWGDLSDSIQMSGFVDRSKVGVYTIKYDCTNPAPWKRSAIQAVRTVTVQDTTDPVITVRGLDRVSIEASFPYVDAGATCLDNIDGSRQVVRTGSVNVEVAAAYTLTYTCTDASNNHAQQKVRTVVVEDTLKPVIALKFGDSVIHKSNAEDKGLGEQSNPAKSYFMAEQAQGFNAWAIGAVAASVAGLALVAYTQRSANSNLGQLV